MMMTMMIMITIMTLSPKVRDIVCILTSCDYVCIKTARSMISSWEKEGKALSKRALVLEVAGLKSSLEEAQKKAQAAEKAQAEKENEVCVMRSSGGNHGTLVHT